MIYIFLVKKYKSFIYLFFFIKNINDLYIFFLSKNHVDCIEGGYIAEIGFLRYETICAENIGLQQH